MTICRRTDAVPDAQAARNHSFRSRARVSDRRPLGTEGPINLLEERET